MSRLLPFILLFFAFLNVQAEVIITPSEVYSQVLLIEQETQLVKRHFNSDKQPAAVIPVTIDIQPRHVWQKAYMLQMKLVTFRRQQQMVAITPVDMEPREQIDPRYTWSQTQRILTEIRIIRKILGIDGEVKAVPVVEGKKPVDVFNKLAEIDAEWDVITGDDFDSSYAFAQVLRLNEDVNMILNKLNVFDNAIPPVKNLNSSSNDSLAEAFAVLEQVQRLQKMLGIKTMNFSVFRKTEKATPTDVFDMACLILAEIQQIKDRIGLEHAITPAATYQQGKKSANVQQFLGYVRNKLILIEHL